MNTHFLTANTDSLVSVVLNKSFVFHARRKLETVSLSTCKIKKIQEKKNVSQGQIYNLLHQIFDLKFLSQIEFCITFR